MLSNEHPSAVLEENEVTTIRACAAEAEQLGALHPRQLELIYRHNWFHLFVPRRFGGLELTLPEAVLWEEALAWADGSLGWTVTLCSGANWFIGFLDPGISNQVFGYPQSCLAGSGNPGGVARILPGGFEITGKWNWATGARHATAFTVNCMLEKDGKQITESDGQPAIKSFLLLPDEVSLVDNWQMIGMKATGSIGLEASGVLVPANRAFLLHQGGQTLSDSIYRFPFLEFAAVTLAANFSGMALHFIDLSYPLLQSRNWDLLTGAGNEIQILRKRFFQELDLAWNAVRNHHALDPTMASKLLSACRELSLSSIAIVDRLYPWCGMTAADPATEINRVWRDLHTASQHALLRLPL